MYDLNELISFCVTGPSKLSMDICAKAQGAMAQAHNSTASLQHTWFTDNRAIVRSRLMVRIFSWLWIWGPLLCSLTNKAFANRISFPDWRARTRPGPATCGAAHLST